MPNIQIQLLGENDKFVDDYARQHNISKADAIITIIVSYKQVIENHSRV